ncbi:MAG: YlxR family protein [Polyangiaceae bacterium]
MNTEEAITNENERDPNRDSGREPKNARTCVGCGAKDAPNALVRLVFADPGVVVDASGKASRDFGGRGAHVHPRKVCVQMACKNGLSRAFKATVKANADDLAKEIAGAFDRRIEGLITSARGAGALIIGSDKGLAALRNGAPLAIIACDAGSIAQKDEVVAAIAEGRAIAWRDKNGLGGIVDRQDVAMFVVENSGIARAIREAAGAVASLGADERNGSEVR